MEYPPTKRCSHCGKSLLRALFYKAKARPDGLQSICKSCTKEANAARKRANPDWWRKYRENAPEKTPEQKERDQARARRWLDENPERARENRRRWEASNPEKARAIRVKRAATRKARLVGLFVEPVDPRRVFTRDHGVCGICATPVDPADFHVDHVVPLARGGEHSYSNVQVAHPLCNRRKWARLPVAA